MNANAGSNKAQWSAMDLHTARVGGARSNASGAGAMKVDDSGLSARNILIRRKLMERKRFDSADYAMKKSEEGAMADTSSPVGAGTYASRAFYTQQQNYTGPAVQTANNKSAPFSPAQVGASVFYSALGGGESDENVDMDAKSIASSTSHLDSSASKSSAAQSASVTATDVAAARSASRYGSLPAPPGGAQSARNILIQKKLREKKHFDSADYQLAQVKTTPPSSTDGNSSVGEESNTATPMEIDLTPVTEPAVESINSPSAASIAHRRMNAQMSPSVRGGKYGSGLSGANVLLMRKLSEKKRFDSADYHMEAAPVAAKANQQFFVTAATPAAPTSSSSTRVGMGPPAPQMAAASSAGGNGGSKYGKLSAVNVLIRKKLKERKRFDSADYVMEKQGRGPPQNGGQGGSSGTLQGGHVVMGTPMTHNVNMAYVAAEENKSINHQVKHIKLSEEGGGWATRVPASFSSSGSASSPSASFNSAKRSSGDSRQHKLSERKRFDSTDCCKEAA